MYATITHTLVINTIAGWSGPGGNPGKLILGVLVYPHYLTDFLAAVYADMVIDEISELSNGSSIWV